MPEMTVPAVSLFPLLLTITWDTNVLLLITSAKVLTGVAIVPKLTGLYCEKKLGVREWRRPRR
jgi:hypothetical protein